MSRETESEPLVRSAYLVSGVVLPHLLNIFFKCLLVDGCLAHVHDLDGFAMLSECQSESLDDD